MARCVLSAIRSGALPRMQQGSRQWADLETQNGSTVMVHAWIDLTLRMDTPHGVVAVRTRIDPDMEPDPLSIDVLRTAVSNIIEGLEAALAGNGSRAMAARRRELLLLASREALDAGHIEDKVSISMPSLFRKARVSLHSTYTDGSTVLPVSTSAAAEMPITVQVCEDHAGTMTVLEMPSFVGGRKCKAARLAGPLALAA